jgi:glycosyltransferase involved in cell wall biosynthesis
MDIGIVLRVVDQYAGDRRFLLECMARWQHQHRLTLYSTWCSDATLAEHGIDLDRIRRVLLHPAFEGPNAAVLNTVLLPRIWEQELGQHEIYNFHRWPTHLIDRHPSVLCPQDPWRRFHDLRHEQPIEPDAAMLLARLGQAHRIGDLANEASRNAIERLDLLGNPDRVVANSRFAARLLERAYGHSVTDIVYPGVTLDDYPRQAVTENFVLAVNRYCQQKRCRLLLEAVQQVPGIQLYVVGEDPTGEKAQLQRMAEWLGIADRVVLLTAISHRELRSLYARCLAVLFAPLREPFGITPLEALAAGKPLIAVREGGFTEVIDDSCALFVKPRPDALAAAIRELVHDPVRAQVMGEAGREIASRFTWDRTATELAAIFENTLRDWRARQTSTASGQRADRGSLPLCGVHYFCWYGDGCGAENWQHGFGPALHDMPALGFYPSASGAVIEEHLRCLEEVGFDFLIVNLHPDDPETVCRELAVLDRLDEVADEMQSSLRYTVCLEAAACSETLGQVANLIQEDLAKRPRYLRLPDRPVLLLRWPQSSALNPGCPALLGKLQETFTILEAANDMSDLERKIGAMRVLTISAGHSDRSGSELEGIFSERQADFYRAKIETAVAVRPSPDVLIVTSFNDYRSETHIEESRRNGSMFLNLTRRLIRSFKEVGVAGRSASDGAECA